MNQEDCYRGTEQMIGITSDKKPCCQVIAILSKEYGTISKPYFRHVKICDTRICDRWNQIGPAV